MRLILHRAVHSDINQIVAYYVQAGNQELAAEFYDELRQLMLEASERPESFSIRERKLRRANLRRFPYHFLFRVVGDSVKVLVVRHHSRHPALGRGRR